MQFSVSRGIESLRSYDQCAVFETAADIVGGFFHDMQAAEKRNGRAGRNPFPDCSADQTQAVSEGSESFGQKPVNDQIQEIPEIFCHFRVWIPSCRAEP